jgi:hypothetical protein
MEVKQAEQQPATEEASAAREVRRQGKTPGASARHLYRAGAVKKENEGSERNTVSRNGR